MRIKGLQQRLRIPRRLMRRKRKANDSWPICIIAEQPFRLGRKKIPVNHA
jgi:hypothetical protein